MGKDGTTTSEDNYNSKDGNSKDDGDDSKDDRHGR